ncbi:MAG TPA: CotH kinase family protein [Polyangiaceae bacterium]|nr:CotH kinase family protein [Polyangiaceae bacterium]
MHARRDGSSLWLSALMAGTLVTAACSSSNEPGAAPAAGGANGGTSGAGAATGGSLGGQNPSTTAGRGGSTSAGGASGASAGGTSGGVAGGAGSSNGGKTASGGGSTSGGSPATGGSTARGGASAGGAPSMGGSGSTMPDSTDGKVFFDGTKLHQIDIVVESAHLGDLDSDTDNRVPCKFTYDGVSIENAGIRRKGQSTLQPLAEKPSFSIKLDEFVMGADIDGVQKFALNNTVKDPSYASEVVAYETYRRAGVPAPRTAHAVVRFNGTLKGLYVVSEAINKRFLKHAFGNGDGNLYEGPWDFDKDVEQADLKDIEDGRKRDDLAALKRAITSAGDAQLWDAIEPLMDANEMLTTVAVEMAANLWDGYAVAAWNYYLYNVPGGRFVMLPHGADWPYWYYQGDTARSTARLNPMDVDYRPWGEGSPSGILAVRLVAGNPDRYRAELSRVAREAFVPAALEAELDRVDRVVHQVDTKQTLLASTVREFEPAIKIAHQFIKDRSAYLASQGFK